MPELKKYLNRDGLEDYNSLLPHSAGEMQAYVDTWLDAHPEATTTVQDGSITTQKLADGSVTRNKLAADVAHLLGGMMVTGEVQGEILSADDAYSVSPLSMEIDGKSTQNGTPTPDNPVPIDSIEVLELTVTFAGNVTPIIANIPMQGYVLRSLPDGTCDTMSLSYLRESDSAGWAWYSRELVQAVDEIEINSFSSVGTNMSNQCVATAAIGGRFVDVYTAAGATLRGASNRFTPQQSSGNYVTNGHFVYYAGNGLITFAFANGRFANVTEANAWLAENPTYVHMKLRTPTTETLDPIELPILPAPNCTIWSDPATGLKMSYMRDANIVVSNIEQAIADL